MWLRVGQLKSEEEEEGLVVGRWREVEKLSSPHRPEASAESVVAQSPNPSLAYPSLRSTLTIYGSIIEAESKNRP